MPRLEWDRVGDRKFRAGLDRGVLYLPDKAIPWNGLTGLDESSDRTSTPYYQDGIKFIEAQSYGDFSGTLKAFTYPEEFEPCLGITTRNGNGLFFHEQPIKAFGLSYRTQIGDDVNGLAAGYEIHLVYNLKAGPAGISHATTGNTLTPEEFSWALTSTPEFIPGRRPTAHISFRTTDMEPGMVQYIEDLLYGSGADVAYLPTIGELVDIFDNPVVLTDNGDGTWTAVGSGRQVVLLSDTAFEIKGVDVKVLDADTYEATSGD